MTRESKPPAAVETRRPIVSEEAATDTPKSGRASPRMATASPFPRPGFLEHATGQRSPDDDCDEGVPDHGICRTIAQSPGVKGPVPGDVDDYFNRSNKDSPGVKMAWWGDLDTVVACKCWMEERDKARLVDIKKTLVSTLEHKASTPFTSLWLAAFSLFVLKDYELCSRVLDELDEVSLSLDAVFLRFAIHQKMMQTVKSNNLGNEMTAIGLMEASKEQENASNYHSEAVRQLRLFWRDVASGKDSSNTTSRISAFFTACEKATVHHTRAMQHIQHTATYTHHATHTPHYPDDVSGCIW
mmetsp:Transcript_68704/g.161531  ORF Transcript_68704/g.161531 Transcript_68704/m.161531 type:complete len:299 (-) Transcript_68704:911-1807(-)